MIKRRLIQDIRPPRCQSRRKFSAITKLLFSGLIILIILVGVFFVTPTGRMYAQVFAALTQGNYQLKIFIQSSEVIEQSVNNWLAGQENIIVDQIKASVYGSDYAVIVQYHSGGAGKVSTRIKIFNANTLTGTVEDSQKTVEMRAQEFISSLSPEHNIRSADIFAGNGPWDIFIVYDDEQGQVLGEVYEPVEQNVENVEQYATSTSPTSAIDANTDSESEIMETALDNVSTPTEMPVIGSTSSASVIQENEEMTQ